MAFVEEVFKNKGGWFGGHTGHKYEKSDIEEIGGIYWSKGCYQPVDKVVLNMDYDESDEQPEEPHEKLEKGKKGY